MMKRIMIRNLIALFTIGAALLFAAACSGGGTGSGSSSSTCDSSTTHTVDWTLSGSYDGSVSVATTWVNPSGGLGSDTSIDPAPGTLLTETVPGCSGASINITMLDGGNDDLVVLTNLTLSIYVDGTLADSVTFTGFYSDDGPTILPTSGALTVVVGE